MAGATGSPRPVPAQLRMMIIGRIEMPGRFYFKVSQAAQYLGISANTLRKYADLGLVKAKRLPSGDRIYSRLWLDGFVSDLPDGVENDESVWRKRQGATILARGNSTCPRIPGKEE